MAKLKDSQRSQMTDTLLGDPEFAAAREAYLTGPKVSAFKRVMQPPDPTDPISTMNRRMGELGVDLPEDYSFRPKHGDINRAGFMERNRDWLGLAGMGGIAGAAFLPALLGAGGAAGGGASTPALSSLPVSAGASVPAAGSVPLGMGAAAGGIKGALMNPMVLSTLIQSGLGFLGGMGGDDQDDQRTSFEGTGPTDPRNVSYNLLANLYPLLQGLQERARTGTQLRSSYVPPPPAPINIPGLPFQIGGGLGTDPAFADRELLRMPGLNIPQLAPGDKSAGGVTHPQLRSSSSSSSAGGDSAFKRITNSRRKGGR